MAFYDSWVIFVRTLCYLSIPFAFCYMLLLVITLKWKSTDLRWLNFFMPRRMCGTAALFRHALTNMSFVVVIWWLAEYTQAITAASFYSGVVAFFMVALVEVALNDLWRHKHAFTPFH